MANAVGRPPRFKTPKELQQAFADWKEEFKLGGSLFNEMPDVEGFCDYVDTWRDLLHEYEAKPEFSHTIKRIKNWIYYRKKQEAMRNKMPAAIFIFDAINNAGYSNKTETDITSNGETVAQPIDANMLTQFLMNVNDNTKR